jgi:undecaprenyl diphosphate synthase
MQQLTIPKHVAIIMDGNHRWAKQNNISIDIAYKKGAEAAEKVIHESFRLGVKYLTLYAFSIDNWNRPSNEIALIMSIFKATMLRQIERIMNENMRIIFIGDRSKIPDDVLDVMLKVEKLSEQNAGFFLIIAFSYSSRNEIMNAAFLTAKNSTYNDIESYTENFQKNINPYNIPDPDLLIRTSGEVRISNFLLWEIAYTEMYFINILWPDFDENDLKNAYDDFRLRQRRFGKR